MLILCSFDNFMYKEGQTVFNLSSPVEGVPRLELLPPFQSYDIKQFDIEYYNYIINNDGVFYEFMSKIIMNLYFGINVIILIGKGEVYEFISESLQKLIQQRYGINSYVINDIEDYEMLNIDKTQFSLQGLYNLDKDKERFIELFGRIHQDEINKELGSLGDNL